MGNPKLTLVCHYIFIFIWLPQIFKETNLASPHLELHVGDGGRNVSLLAGRNVHLNQNPAQDLSGPTEV